MSAALIAIDWGTTSARAYWFDSEGRVVHSARAPLGVQKVTAGGFDQALTTLLGTESRAVPMIACGMVGSRQGWIEAPYRDCPADVTNIASALTPVPGIPLAIVPGLACREANGIPDVMRGEETQLLGAMEAAAQSELRIAVLPGTHSKWVVVRGGTIERFRTFLTGELYAVLMEHSILGRLAAAGDDRAARARGLRRSLADDADLSHDLFSVRTLALSGELAPGAVGDYLSGLLLGAELAAGLRWVQRQRAPGEPVHLIGDAILCARYAEAFALAGIETTLGPADAAALGLWRIARHAKVIRA
jgi:2-dehydro-3-deoxygalactonokinase